MFWNYRIIRTKYEDEYYYEICETYYDEKGIPNSFAESKNVLSQDSIEGLTWAYKEIEKAYKAPVLEYLDGELIEIKTCPNCNKQLKYGTLDSSTSTNEENFGKTFLTCPRPDGCGYFSIRPDYANLKDKKTSI